MEGLYNLRSPAVKRLMKEASELSQPTELFHAQPLEDNLFEWHFTVRGPPDSDFDSGVYHGRIILPSEYPMKPPSIMMLTPNGRFELNKKICLSISGYHPETWQPSWSIRTALLAIIGFLPTHGDGAIGSLDYTPEERKNLAKKSQDWKCNTCDIVLRDVLPPLGKECSLTQEAKELGKQLIMKAEEKKPEDEEKTTNSNLQPEEELHGSSSRGDATSVTNDFTAESPSELRQRQPQSSSSSSERPRWNLAGPNAPGLSTSPSSAELQAQDGEGNSGSVSLLMIVLVSLMIAALVARRIYLMNEWRFHSTQ